VILLAYAYVRGGVSRVDRYFAIEDFAKVDFPPVSQIQTHVEGGAVFAHFQTDKDGLSSFLQESELARPEAGCWPFTITPSSSLDWWTEESLRNSLGDSSCVVDRHEGIICRQVLIVEGSETVDVYLAAALCKN
jgi:hypothetical protein